MITRYGSGARYALPKYLAYEDGDGVLSIKNPAFNGGADRNGVKDSTSAIQAAVSEAQAGDIVYIPRGVYLVSDTIDLSGKEDITIMGAGGYASRIFFDPVTSGKKCALNLVGSRKITLQHHLWYSSDVVNSPETIIMMGRPSGDSSSYGKHLLFDLWAGGHAKKCVLYNVASEENTIIGGEYYLDGGGALHTLVYAEEDIFSLGGFMSSSSLLTGWMQNAKIYRNIAYAGVADDLASLIYIEAQRGTGDLVFRDWYGATTGGAGVRIHVPLPPPVLGHGPIVIENVRLESQGTHKYGVLFTKGATAGDYLIRGVDMRRITCGNLDSGVGSYGVYGVDNITLEDCSFYGSLPIKADGSLAGMSVYRTEDCRVDESRTTLTVRDRAVYMEDGQKTYFASATAMVIAVADGGKQAYNLPVVGARMGDLVDVSWNQQLLDGVVIEAQVFPDDNVRIEVYNNSGVNPFASIGTLKAKVTRSR
jgi:hypothetical protein